jgi:hypothetical protein
MSAVAASFLVLLSVTRSVPPWNLEWADALTPVLLAFVLRDIASRRRRALDWFVALYLLTAVVSATTSIDYRASTVALAKDAYLAVVYVVVSELVDRFPEGWVARWLAIGAVATSLAGLAGVFASALGFSSNGLGLRMAVPFVGTLFRPSGLLYTAEMLGDLLTCTLPILVWLARSRDARWWVAVSIAGVTALLTASHALGGLATAALMLLWPAPAPAWRRSRWLAAAMVIAFVAALNFASTVAVRQLSVASGHEKVDAPPFEHAPTARDGTAPSVDLHVAYSPVSYFLLKRVAWSTFAERPWLGTGPGTFHIATERATAEGWLPPTYRQADPHSTWLGRAAETGVVGTLGLALLWTALFKSSRESAARNGPLSLAHAVLAAVAGMLVNSINADVMHFRFLWVLFALAAARSTPRAPSEGPGR